MVTQIYTAPIKAVYTSPIQTGNSNSVKPKPDTLNATDDDRNNSPTLMALKDQAENGVISIHSVITDFQNTMNAIGVTPEVRSEVSPYLQVVALQAQKTQPATGLMKQNLKVAADVLDDHISNTLGQKSTVVREWVDTLLTQPINYHSDTPIHIASESAPTTPIFNTPSQTGGGQSGNQFLSRNSTPLSADDQQNIKETLQTAKSALKNNQPEAALNSYNSILQKVDGQNYPELQGRVYYQMGKAYEKNGNLSQAQQSYQNASDTLANVNQPALQAKVSRSLGSVLSQQGDLDGATKHLQQALTYETNAGNSNGQSMVLNQMAMVQAQKGNLQEAHSTLKQALENTENPVTQANILNNMGNVSKKAGKMGQAFAYYKQSFQTSESQSNTSGMQQSLQNIATLYLETGKPDKAYTALQTALYEL